MAGRMRSNCIRSPIQVPKGVELSGAPVDFFGVDQPEFEDDNKTESDRERSTTRILGAGHVSREIHERVVSLSARPLVDQHCNILHHNRRPPEGGNSRMDKGSLAP